MKMGEGQNTIVKDLGLEISMCFNEHMENVKKKKNHGCYTDNYK